MKRIFIVFFMAFISLTSFAQYRYVVRHVPSTSQYYTNSQPTQEYYFLDRKIEEHKQNRDNTINAGLMTRFGYAFNYDAFTYGASLLYQWNRFLGVTAGFDGYYIPGKTFETSTGELIPSSKFGMPLWDIRAGFGFSKYFWIGGLLGKSNINDGGTIINMRQDAWFINNSEKQFMYGGFVTFVLPISKYFGFNLDFAVTNKTGFNVGGGFNVTIPVR